MRQTADTPPAAKAPRWQWIYPIALLATIQYVSSRSTVAMPSVSHFDKVAHYFAFGLVATLIYRQVATLRRAALLAILLTSLYGALDEIHQSFVPGRSAGIDDWIADTLGALTAILAYTRWNFYRRVLETPLLKIFPRENVGAALDDARNKLPTA